MTQENLPPDAYRSRPRYQPPATGSFANVSSQPQPVVNPNRPSDWPAPDPAYAVPPMTPDPNFGAYPPPPVTPGPNFGTYVPPVTPDPNFGTYPVPPVAPWNDGSQAGPRADNFYRYERYSKTPYQPQPPDPQAEAYRKASSRVRARLDFQKHLRSYIFVNAILWAIALLTMSSSHPSFWPIWITVFWGIGLFAQYWQISGREDEQRRRMIDEEMRRKHRY